MITNNYGMMNIIEDTRYFLRHNPNWNDALAYTFSPKSAKSEVHTPS